MNNTESNVPETHNEYEEGLIKTPKQLIITVLLAFIIPIAIIVMLVNMVSNSSLMGAGADAYNSEAIAARIKPVANFKLVDSTAEKVSKTGQQVYESTCVACHTSGVANAPKIGDSAAWAPYIQAGYESLIKNALNGVGAMPARGGNPSLSDLEVERAVVYITNQSGASFPEPTEAAEGADAPVAAPAAAAETAPAASETAAAPTPEPAAPAATPEAAPAAVAATVDPAGEKLYKTVCFVCHDSGVAGAPKQGDKDAWAPFVATGNETMLANAIKGVGAMPPRGGSQATDEELSDAINYMMNAIK
ncbi:cytochrome c5 family protein [Alcaligenaceae bacterium]|nr:cytochrome c5 family protein [Alcaligenaceae bacterium]